MTCMLHALHAAVSCHSLQTHTQHQSLSLRHPGAARTGSVAGTTSPCSRHGVERWRVGLSAGPPADLCGWRSAGRWCVRHQPGCHPRHAQCGAPRARRASGLVDVGSRPQAAPLSPFGSAAPGEQSAGLPTGSARLPAPDVERMGYTTGAPGTGQATPQFLLGGQAAPQPPPACRGGLWQTLFFGVLCRRV